MTQRDALSTEVEAKAIMPAWIFSAIFHFSLIVLLGLAIQPSPRGAAEEPGRSAGIVLKTTSSAGDLYEGEEGVDGSTGADEVSPEELLAALPNEPAPTTTPTKTSTKKATDNSGAATSATSGKESNASRFTKGGSGMRGSSGGDGYAKVTVFGVQGEGNKFIYLFDRSSSMEGAPLAAAKRQLLESLGSLEGVHQFHIIFFNTKTQSFDITGGGRRIAFATDRNKKLAANFVGGISADGGTDRLTALKQAISFAPDVIFFLTDADDPMSHSELAEIARDNERVQAAICVIEFGRRQSPSPGNFLSELARQSGGQYGYVNTGTLGK
jgi:von Willebrand factor type A domain